jgi:3-oxoacyl-(acyl-carrier-protein) synthase
LWAAGFGRAQALAVSFNEPEERAATASRPFDTQRAGFVMGEGSVRTTMTRHNSAVIATLVRRRG